MVSTTQEATRTPTIVLVQQTQAPARRRVRSLTWPTHGRCALCKSGGDGSASAENPTHLMPAPRARSRIPAKTRCLAPRSHAVPRSWVFSGSEWGLHSVLQLPQRTFAGWTRPFYGIRSSSADEKSMTKVSKIAASALQVCAPPRPPRWSEEKLEHCDEPDPRNQFLNKHMKIDKPSHQRNFTNISQRQRNRENTRLYKYLT